MSEVIMMNDRPPSARAARLSRDLLRAGMTPLQQSRWSVGGGSAADLKALADRLGVACSPELAAHAVAEWKACYDAVPQVLKDQVARDVALARSREELDW